MLRAHGKVICLVLFAFLCNQAQASQQFFCELVATRAPRARKVIPAPSHFNRTPVANQLRREIFATLVQASQLMTEPLASGHRVVIDTKAGLVTATLVGSRRRLAFDFLVDPILGVSQVFKKLVHVKYASLAPTVVPENLTLYSTFSIGMKAHYDDTLERTGVYLAVYENATGEIRHVFENQNKELWSGSDYVLTPLVRGDHLFFSADFPLVTAAGGVDRLNLISGEVNHFAAPVDFSFVEGPRFAVDPTGQHLLWLHRDHGKKLTLLRATRLSDGQTKIIESGLIPVTVEPDKNPFYFDLNGDLVIYEQRSSWLELSQKLYE